MESRKILLVGGGGHCRSVADCILAATPNAAIGIVERQGAEIQACSSIPVVGFDDDLPSLFRDGWTEAVVTLGSIGNPARRQVLYQHLKELGFELPVISDPSAVISRNAKIEQGAFIGKRTVINAGAHIGVCSIINTGAVLEHDCIIGAFAHISPGTILCGEVTVGEGAHIGAGSVVRQQLQVGENALIGIGSVVVCDIPSDCVAYGNPCKVVQKS